MPKVTTTASDLDTASIVERLADEKDRLFKLRLQNATGTLENTAGLRSARKEIARYETELRAREIEAAEALAQEQEEKA
jgi:large subunit ribosomal protein L29